jgi:hypothetical protein
MRDRPQRQVDFEYRYANPAACSIMKGEPESVVGGRLLVRLSEAREQPQLFPRYARVFFSGETSGSEYELGGRWFHGRVAKLDDGIVADRQSQRADPCPRACHERRRRRDPDPVGLSRSRPGDRTRDHLFARRRDFRRHGDHIVTWLVGVTGNPLASAYYAMAANVIMLLAVLAVRQTDFEPKQWPPPVDRNV